MLRYGNQWDPTLCQAGCSDRNLTSMWLRKKWACRCIKLSMESYTWKSTDVGQNYVKLLMSPCGTHISNSCYPRGNVKQFLDEFWRRSRWQLILNSQTWFGQLFLWFHLGVQIFSFNYIFFIWEGNIFSCNILWMLWIILCELFLITLGHCIILLLQGRCILTCKSGIINLDVGKAGVHVWADFLKSNKVTASLLNSLSETWRLFRW